MADTTDRNVDLADLIVQLQRANETAAPAVQLQLYLYKPVPDSAIFNDTPMTMPSGPHYYAGPWLVSNGSFENWSAGPSSPPDGWFCPFGGTNAAARSTDSVIGTYSAQFTGGTVDGRCARTSISLVNGQSYNFGMRLKSISGSPVVAIDINDTNLTNAVTINTSWGWYVFTATYTGAATSAGAFDIALGAVSSTIRVDGMMAVSDGAEIICGFFTAS